MTKQNGVNEMGYQLKGFMTLVIFCTHNCDKVTLKH